MPTPSVLTVTATLGAAALGVQLYRLHRLMKHGVTAQQVTVILDGELTRIARKVGTNGGAVSRAPR